MKVCNLFAVLLVATLAGCSSGGGSSGDGGRALQGEFTLAQQSVQINRSLTTGSSSAEVVYGKVVNPSDLVYIQVTASNPKLLQEIEVFFDERGSGRLREGGGQVLHLTFSPLT